MRSIVALFTLLALAGCGSGKGKDVTKSGHPDDPVVTNFDEKAMDAAIAEAKATLATFDAELKKKDAQYYAIKKGYPTNSGSVEHCWVGYVALDGDVYVGKMDNIPANLKEPLKAGDAVRVERKDISDWMVMKGGKLYGGYTIKVMEKHGISPPQKIVYGDIKELK